MSIFKKKLFVILIAVMIIISSTILSVNIKLTKEFREVTEGFYSGVMVDGKRDVSIHSQLMIIAREATVLANLAERNGLEVAELKDKAEWFSRDVATMEDNISYIYYIYQELLDKLTETAFALKELKLSAADEATAVSSLQTIIEAQAVIDDSGYNDSVRKYLISLQFPTDFFAELAGVWPPEYFA